MKRYLSILLLLLIPFSTHAVLDNFTFGSEVRIRNDHKELSISNKDKRNTTQFRARIKIEKQITDKIKLNFTPQATKNFGEVASQSNDENDSSVLTSGDKYHSSVDLFEAYVHGQRDHFEYKLGRQTLSYGDNIILGRRNWTAGGLVFDALKFSVPVGLGELDVVYSQISEGSDVSDTSDDIDLTFAYWKMLKEESHLLDIYLIHNNDKQGIETLNLGLRLRFNIGSFDFRTESIAQRHSSFDRTEHSLNNEIGYNFNENFRLHIGYDQNSGSYNHLYTNRHRYNGAIDIVGRTNLVNMNIGSTYKYNSDLSFKLLYLKYRQHETGVGAYNQATSAILAGDSGQKDIGQEVNFFTSLKVSKYESLKLGFSLFDHGDYFTSSPSQSTFTYLQYQLKI